MRTYFCILSDRFCSNKKVEDKLVFKAICILCQHDMENSHPLMKVSQSINIDDTIHSINKVGLAVGEADKDRVLAARRLVYMFGD